MIFFFLIQKSLSLLFLTEPHKLADLPAWLWSLVRAQNSFFFSPCFMWMLNLRAQGWAFFYPSFLELEMSWLAGLFRCLSVHVHVMEWGSLIQNPDIQKWKLKSLCGSECVSSVGWQDGCCTDIRGQLAGVLPFHHVHSRDRTQIIRLGRRHLDLLRYCDSPSSMFSDSLFYSLTQLDPA